MEDKNKKEKDRIDEELKEIIIARLEIFPSGKKISIGSSGEFTKEEMIENVRQKTAIGEKIMQVQLNYLRSLKDGIFYEQDFVDNAA